MKELVKCIHYTPA